ncbi:MAG: hypothetical protein JO002_01505 [Burkholderiaceae bacterium]|nr:hypothetical protein [Burkholderiaceae bacterium]
MAISPLSVQQIVAVIRQQIAAPVDKTPNPAASAAATPSRTPRKPSPKTPHEAKQRGIGEMIARRVGAIKKTDPDRGRKAFRIFLESVLINELGENLINDPAFYQMVEDVQRQMESMPEVEPLLREAIGQLLTGK